MPTAEDCRISGFSPEDYEQDPVEVWPENFTAFDLFCKLSTQWLTNTGGATGLNYLVLFALMDRLKLTDEDHDDMFSDIQVLERAALKAMSARD